MYLTIKGISSFLLIISLILFSGGVNILFTSQYEDSFSRSEGVDYVAQLIKFPIYFFGLYSLAHLFRYYRGDFYLTFIISVLLFMIFSSAWSIDFNASITRSVLLFLTFLGAYFISAYYSKEEFIRIMVLFFIILAFISLASVLISTSTSIHQDNHYPSLRGYFAHKNVAGRVFVIGVIVGLYGILSFKRKAMSYLCFISSFIIVFLTLSGTAIFLSVSSVLLFLFLSAARVNRKFFVISIILLFLVIPLTTFLLFYSGAHLYIFELLGKDPTLTGRTNIWEKAFLDVIPHNYILGYGYESFWTSLEGAFMVDWEMYHYIPPHAHNGLIHIFISTGLIGVVFTLLFMFYYITHAAKFSLSNGDNFSVLCIVFAIYLVFVNATEVVYFQYGNIIWLFSLVLYLYVTRKNVC